MYAPAPRVAPPANRFVFSVPRFADLRHTILSQLVAVVGCAAAVFAFLFLESITASVVVLVALALGLVGISRHWTLARWWTFGVLLGGLLGRFS
jgi:hypothetical protein